MVLTLRCFLISCFVPFSIICAQNKIEDDTLFTDNTFTTGSCFEVQTALDGKDTVRTIGGPGIEIVGYVYICYPRFIDMDYMMQSRHYWPDERSYTDSLHMSKDFFYAFSDSFIDTYIKDRVGDTVMVVGSNGRFKATITAIGMGYTMLSHHPYCILLPNEKLAEPPKLIDILLIFRKGHFYNGPIYGFHNIKLNDSNYPNMIQKVSNIFGNSWKTVEHNYYGEPCQYHINAYGNNNEQAPSDTIFIFMTCNLGLDDNGDYANLYLATKFGNDWKIEEVIETGHDTNWFGFGFDLDANGIPEYIYATQEFDGFFELIITKSGSGWIEK
ncbi:MAG TPA: hypothetical protein DEO84_10995 [candidate division Zixibacteria bacterium]|jgi:hypothetical protein|nr:hypothetical protein [candidate division Zixibacteria bacterium]HBZ01834.1 hypothetical protein [candidate division Zixibacteria bacterium]